MNVLLIKFKFYQMSRSMKNNSFVILCVNKNLMPMNTL